MSGARIDYDAIRADARCLLADRFEYISVSGIDRVAFARDQSDFIVVVWNLISVSVGRNCFGARRRERKRGVPGDDVGVRAARRQSAEKRQSASEARQIIGLRENTGLHLDFLHRTTAGPFARTLTARMPAVKQKSGPISASKRVGPKVA